jgi:hypothetical protein
MQELEIGWRLHVKRILALAARIPRAGSADDGRQAPRAFAIAAALPD